MEQVEKARPIYIQNGERQSILSTEPSTSIFVSRSHHVFTEYSIFRGCPSEGKHQLAKGEEKNF